MLIQTLIDRIACRCARCLRPSDSNAKRDEQGRSSALSEGTDVPLVTEAAQREHRSPYDIPTPFRLL